MTAMTSESSKKSELIANTENVMTPESWSGSITEALHIDITYLEVVVFFHISTEADIAPNWESLSGVSQC